MKNLSLKFLMLGASMFAFASMNAQDCVSPASISNGVPLIGETSCGTGVLLPDNVCSANYDADVAPQEAKVYSYTTGVTAEDITVAMTNIVDTWSGVSMVSGACGDTSATCLGFYGTGSGSADGGFTAIGVPAATTVYLYITTFPTPNCVSGYDLSLTASTAAVCGDAVCAATENFVSCPTDCSTPSAATCQKASTLAAGDTIVGAVILQGIMTQDTVCNGGTSDARWYKWTAPADGFLDIEALAGGDTYLSLLSGGCSSLVCIDEDDDGAATGLLSALFDVPVTSGTVYRIEWDDRYASGADPFDFTLTFTLPPTCPNPSGLSATPDTASTDVLVEWTNDAGATSSQVKYGEPGFDVLTGGTQVGSDTDTSKTLTGLTVNTQLDYYVRAACGGGAGNSEWVFGGTFLTSGDAVCGDGICSFSESFVNCEADCGVAPQGATCQKAIVLASGDTIVGAEIFQGVLTQDTVCNGGTREARWYKWTAPADGFLDIEALVGGDTYLNLLAGGCANLVCVDQDDDGAATGLLSALFDVPVTSGTVYRIEWDDRWTTGFEAFDFTINFTLPPPCPNPSGLSVSAVDSVSASILWVDNAGASTWQVQYDTAGFVIGTGTQFGVADTNATITGLENETSYDVYVRATCGAPDGNSEWVQSSFTTLAGPLCDGGSFLIYLPDTVGQGPALIICSGDTVPASYTAAGDQVCAQQIIDGDSFCLTTSWDAICEADYQLCANPPTCPNPSDLSAAQGEDFAVINWLDNAGASSWQVRYDTAGFDVDTGGMTQGSADTSATITGLTADTDYDYYVRALCGPGLGNSEWVGGSFTTASAPVDLACDDTFIDSGDTSDYSNNELITYNICPDNPGDVVTLTFSFVDIEANAFGSSNQDGCWDFLTIYDGPDVASPVLAQTLCGELDGDGSIPSDTTSLLQAGDVFMSSGGCLTVVFTSDGSVPQGGWEATIDCGGGTDCSVYDTPPVGLTKSFDAVNGVQDRVQVKWFKSAGPSVAYSDEDAAACDIKFWPKRNLIPGTTTPTGPAIIASASDTVEFVDTKKFIGNTTAPRSIFKWPVKFRKASDSPSAKRADPNIRYEWKVRCACEHGAGVESPWSATKIFNVLDFDPVTGIYTPPPGTNDENGQYKSITASADLSIYPNPVSGDEINLVLTDLDDVQAMAIVSLRDVTGKLVFSESYAVKGNSMNEQIRFNNQLGEGIYMLSIEIGSTVYHDRLMVK